MGTWTLGIGILAVALLVRLAEQDNVSVLLIDGRLAAPTGYFNGTAALFFMARAEHLALAVPGGCPARCAAWPWPWPVPSSSSC